MKLKKDDFVVSANVLKDDQYVLVVSEKRLWQTNSSK